VRRDGAPVPALSADERLVAILEGSADAILATDTQGVITDRNPAAESLYDYTRAEAPDPILGVDQSGTIVPRARSAAT